VDGGAWPDVKAIEMAAPMATVAVTVLVLSAWAAAVMVTVPPVGAAAGAVKVVGAPLAVCAALTEPHAALAQVTVQSTPAFVESLAIRAVNID
jgi:hypothetical protein